MTDRKTILIVDDEKSIRDSLRLILKGSFNVETAEDGAQCLNLVEQVRPDLILLDVMMPKQDGLDTLRQLRDREIHVPVIMLTARGEEVDRIVGLELGAEDYVVKPFSPREFLLRVKAVLKRSQPEKPERTLWRKDGLAVDLEAHKAMVDDQEIVLTATEFKLLAELLRRPGRVQTSEQLLDTVWGYEFEGYARTVDTHIRRLRQKLGTCAEYIETIRGVGYRFKD